jgi:hypothetical protein
MGAQVALLQSLMLPAAFSFYIKELFSLTFPVDKSHTWNLPLKTPEKNIRAYLDLPSGNASGRGRIIRRAT